MKMLWIIISFIIPAISYSQHSNTEKLNQIGNIQRLAFGSCNKQYSEQPLWKDLIIQSPDLFIWGGDNIYANTENQFQILESYQKQNEVEDYRSFKALTPIIGTWDDHDYGDNDADGAYPLKKFSREYALDFFEEPIFSERRFRDGIYTSYEFGDADKKIKIILLDNRYFMNLDLSFPLLGKAQWEWLDKEIKSSDASLFLIVSSLSILSPSSPGSEEWADYPLERLRLRRMLERKNKPYLYLTGDKHFSSIFTSGGEMEFISSGMTHTTRIPLRPYVRKQYPDPVFDLNYGLIDFAWENQSPILTLTIRTEHGMSLNVKKVKWDIYRWKEI